MQDGYHCHVKPRLNENLKLSTNLFRISKNNPTVVVPLFEKIHQCLKRVKVSFAKCHCTSVLFPNFKREQQVSNYIKANICASEANIAI